jgi:hypothetical protein
MRHEVVIIGLKTEARDILKYPGMSGLYFPLLLDYWLGETTEVKLLDLVIS